MALHQKLNRRTNEADTAGDQHKAKEANPESCHKE